MKKRTSVKEMGAICGALIEDFLKRFHYSNTRVIDIETFVTDYLGAKVIFEVFAEECPGRGGFISDGTVPLQILRDGIIQNVQYPENTIVIDSSLRNPDEFARLRFTLAHEAAHLIMRKHIPGDYSAAFHTEFVEGQNYNPDIIMNMLSVTETLTNKAAASLLMPDFIVQRALNTYNNGEKVTVYVGSDLVLPYSSKIIIQRMADSMGVSFSACYYRLKELFLLEERPLAEYIMKFVVKEAS